MPTSTLTFLRRCMMLFAHPFLSHLASTFQILLTDCLRQTPRQQQQQQCQWWLCIVWLATSHSSSSSGRLTSANNWFLHKFHTARMPQSFCANPGKWWHQLHPWQYVSGRYYKSTTATCQSQGILPKSHQYFCSPYPLCLPSHLANNMKCSCLEMDVW